MRDAIVTEYVELCEQLAAAEMVDDETDLALNGRLDQLWYVEMLEDERCEAIDRLVAGARAWHDARRLADP